MWAKTARNHSPPKPSPVHAQSVSITVRDYEQPTQTGAHTMPTPDLIPVILDCDPGTDDVFALLLALASPEIDLLAVTVAGG